MDESSPERVQDAATVLDKTPARQVGSELSDDQREACILMVAGDLTNAVVAERVGVSERTIDRWRADEDCRRYLQRLTNEATVEATRRVKSIFTRKATEIADTIVRLGLGKGRRGKPSHPYQKDYLIAALDRIAGKPQGAASTVGVEVNAQQGTVRVIWRREDA
jgi:predicted RNA-binding Zn ribbon-like protein